MTIKKKYCFVKEPYFIIKFIGTRQQMRRKAFSKISLKRGEGEGRKRKESLCSESFFPFSKTWTQMLIHFVLKYSSAVLLILLFILPSLLLPHSLSRRFTFVKHCNLITEKLCNIIYNEAYFGFKPCSVCRRTVTDTQPLSRERKIWKKRWKMKWSWTNVGSPIRN